MYIQSLAITITDDLIVMAILNDSYIMTSINS